jgi:hypothetical protein
MSDVLEDIRYRFGAGGLKNRHPPTRILQLFNVSLQEVQKRVSLADDGSFMDATAVTALPTTAAVTGEVYAEIAWPVNAMRVYGVRVQRTSTSEWYPLKKIPWAALHDFQHSRLLGGYLSQPGPIAYASRRIPRGVGAVETAGAIMILPVPTGGNYRLWYQQNYTPQVAESDLTDSHSGWIEWAIYDTLIKMLGPDADSRKAYDMFDKERTRQQELIEAEAVRLSDGMAEEPRDGRDDGYEREGWGGPL